MKVSIVRGGGLAGIPVTTRIDTDSLPAEAAAELEAKVGEASLLSAPGAGPTGPTHPDDLLYEVAVAGGGEERVHRFRDSTLPAPVRSLIEWIDARPEREVRAGPPGG